MKKEFFIWVGLGIGITFCLWRITDFYNLQENNFKNQNSTKIFLQKKLKSLQEDVVFINDHKKTLQFLTDKGWFIPKNRLIVADVLENLRFPLNEIQFTFEPENIKSLDEKFSFKITRILIEVGALFDHPIYEFIEKFLEKFPGILTPIALTLTRKEQVNEKNLFSLRQKKRPNFVEGNLVFEWISLGEDVSEK